MVKIKYFGSADGPNDLLNALVCIMALKIFHLENIDLVLSKKF